jgi:hypothetical protein
MTKDLIERLIAIGRGETPAFTDTEREMLQALWIGLNKTMKHKD